MKTLHVVLLILNIVSVLFILQIVFNIIPFFSCGLPLENIDRINNFVTDLSIGVITSTFFYYLLVYIPEVKKRRYALKALEPLLSSVSSSLFNILYITYRNSNNPKLNGIDDFRQFQLWSDLEGKKMNGRIAKELNTIVQDLKRKIDDIFKNALTVYLKEDLVESLSSASNSIFVTKTILYNIDTVYVNIFDLSGITDIFHLYISLSSTKTKQIDDELLILITKNTTNN